MDYKLGEDVSAEDVYKAYFAYAKAAKELGDVAGRKMIFLALEQAQLGL
ncbi:MAG: hypothetical protein CM15mP126_6310 [Gammaproteobacteria bacterium]|nr:MAG: hypothetical protein CM15mP126_6310 [Gammaproteobacteria bacterium]